MRWSCRRNARRRTEFMAKKQQILSSGISNMMEQPSKLQLCFHVTNVITWVPLKRGWNNTWGWSTRKLKLHLFPQKLSDQRKSLQGLWLALLFLIKTGRRIVRTVSEGPFSPGHRCGDVEEVEDDAGDSDSEEEESYNEDFEPPVVRLLRTMSSLRNDDKKRAALDMLLQLNSKFNQIRALCGDIYASLAGGIYSCEDCLFI